MKFKQYLTEGRSRSIRFDEAINILKTKCSKAIKSHKHSPIFRGVRDRFSDDVISLIKPKDHTRVSANTSNIYTLLIDDMKSWKQYPNRGQSIICTTDREYSRVYGETYVIFPYDGAKIGVTSSIDFWGGFRYGLGTGAWGDMDAFNSQLNYMISEQMNIRFDKNSAKSMKKSFQMFDKVSGERNDITSIIDSIYWMKDYYKHGSLLKTIENALDPKKNGFKLAKIGDKLIRGVEVWTDSPSIMVKYADTGYDRVMEAIG